jgi:hypothetical protein
MTTRIYQDALENWIVSDGETKYAGFSTELEAQQFARSLVMSVAQEYLDLLRGSTKQSEALIDGLAPAARLRQANGLESLIMATADDEFVLDTNMKGLRAKKLLLMYGNLAVWLNTPVKDANGNPLPGSPTPFQILSERE